MKHSALLATSLSLLACGCATQATVTDSSQIADTGKVNTIVFGYDVTVEFDERHPAAGAADVWLCRETDRKRHLLAKLIENRPCIEMTARYVEPTEESTAEGHHVFASSSTEVLQESYGEYVYEHIEYRVLVDRTERQACQRSGVADGRKVTLTVTHCSTEYDDVFDSHRGELPTPMTVTVAPGAGCYIGTLRLRLDGDGMIDFELDRSAATIDYRTLSGIVRSRLAEHVTRACDHESAAGITTG